MRPCIQLTCLTLFLLFNITVKSQTDSSATNKVIITNATLEDSIAKIQQTPPNFAIKKAGIDSLRNIARGFPVITNLTDTLFVVHSSIEEETLQERARQITINIKKLQDDNFLKIDSLTVVKSANTFDIVYGKNEIVKISDIDAIWYDKSALDLATELNTTIKDSLLKTRDDNSIIKTLQRIGLVLLVIAFLWLIIWLIGRGNTFLLRYLKKNESKWYKKLAYKDYTFLSAASLMQINMFLLKILRWLLYVILFYLSLPVIFSIFPASRGWSQKLFQLLWSPFKNVLIAAWNYLPNLFTILVIFFVMKYFIRFVKFIFSEIENEKLKISGFYSDWARPTFGIVKLLLYAFMIILIFPYLPGSDSAVFKGVSIFIGVLFSLGSSTAISNMIAGLMITYMRPFKIGDRINIAEVTGDVVEKTILVTRVRTPKNEIITIPNSSVLSGNTINYTSEANEKGLIIHTTITIGYDVPWKDIHQALIDASLKTELILQEPKPFVLQTSLDDFYVSYQVNAYTKEASKQAQLYSNLHLNIQNVCNERGIEILSPHYRAERDGNTTTIPTNYLSKEHKAPSSKAKGEKDE